ncbi:MAG: hypothetical protein NTW21_02725 [Verrucomicrobia bacterium]|nr:hypothetical protein [Verrucomicrobiota bacterium]
MKADVKRNVIAMIGLLSVVLVTTGTGGVFNRESPVWYATAPMKVKGVGDAWSPEQGVNLDAKNDLGQPLWSKHRDWPDGKGVGISPVDSSSLKFTAAPAWPASIDPEALRLVIEDLSRNFPGQYPRGAEFLQRLQDLEDQEEKLDEAALRALEREAMLAAPPGMKLVSGTASGNVLTLKLAAPATAKTIIHLTDRKWDPKTLICGKNGIAALTFCEVPVNASTR